MNMKDFNKRYDQYGNNINFSDEILSDMTMKGILGKWTGLLYSDIRYAMFKYYMKTRNIDVDCLNFTKNLFKTTRNKINFVEPVLNDMVAVNIGGIEDIFIGIYGVGSDEVYLLRNFLERCENIDSWDEDYMWNDCLGNERMYKILTGF